MKSATDRSSNSSRAPDAAKPTVTIRGFEIFKRHLDNAAQSELVKVVRGVAQQAPLFSPVTRFGKPMSVQMTSAGRLGWYSDTSGYSYRDRHPSGAPWPNLPEEVSEIWTDVTGIDRTPDCCLINFYRGNARMGLHQDKDEGDFSWPVVSISLGDEALFRMGGIERSDKTESIWLSSGDIVVLTGEARLAFHGVDRIKQGSSQLLAQGGRLNLTLRIVDL